MSTLKAMRRRALACHRIYRGVRFIAKGLLSTRHPLLAHLIPIRRCNLSCTYCNEYDDHSQPVPLEVLFRRVDRLAGFGTGVITISGGEPLLHPELDDLIRHIRRHGRTAGLITNGYLLTADRIERLNRAGLDYLQISIDNIMPDDVSKKSLKVLDRKLELLAEHADFHVNINSVLGGGINKPQDALVIARRAVALGFSTTVGVIHDGGGQLRRLGKAEQEIFQLIHSMGQRRTCYARFNNFQENIAYGRSHPWRCRAGSRYLYICEDGLVHYCSQQRGYPAIPLEEYTPELLRREFTTEKSCAPNCTISCVQQVAMIDNWRAPQRAMPPLQHRPGIPLVQLESEQRTPTEVAPAD